MKLIIEEEQFKEWLKTKGIGENTLHQYLSKLNSFDFNNFDQEHINQFIIKNKSNNVCNAFLNNLIKYIMRTNYYSDDVKSFVAKLYVEIRTGRVYPKLLKIINEYQMRELSQSLNERNRLILYISFYCGLRISELFGDKFNLDIKPLSYDKFNLTSWIKNPKEDAVLTVIGKGGKQREIPVPALLMKLIYKYGRLNNKHRIDKLFDIGSNRWDKILRKKGYEILGLKLHPHDLRASCAAYLFLVQKKDILEVMEILGHDNLETTNRYLNLANKKKKDYFR
jgi:integrase